MLRAAGHGACSVAAQARGCGDWDGTSCADGRALRALCGDGQPIDTICPHEFPAACSPHIAASLAGTKLDLDDLVATASDLVGEHDLITEGAGGLLAPLSHDRRGLRDMAQALHLPLVIVTRPDLGTLHHTAATVEVARSAGLDLLGLVINEPEPVNHHEPAIVTAADELSALCQLPVLQYFHHQTSAPSQATDAGIALAEAILAALPAGADTSTGDA